jgi:Ca-activated chloride channel family protein
MQNEKPTGSPFHVAFFILHFSFCMNHFSRPDLVWLVFLLPVLSVLSMLAVRRQRRALARFGRLPALLAVTAWRRQWRGLRFFCVSMALSILALGIAGPQWGREPVVQVAHGRDLVIVLDLSRSMLADDVLPSRLDHAKRAIRELVTSLHERGGHRISLVAFAGRGRIVCPLTHDYDHFLDRLQELDADKLPVELRPGPESVSGTRMGLGLELAVEAHDARFQGKEVQDIVLLGDGDDPAGDNEWFNGLLAAQKAEIPVHTIGIGDPDKGRPIPAPEPGGYLQHKGQNVLTRLIEPPLQTMAEQTRGIYTPARTGPITLVELFRTKIEPGRKREAVDEALPVYRQRYPWFFGAALLLLTLEMISGKKGKTKSESRNPKSEANPKSENGKTKP